MDRLNPLKASLNGPTRGPIKARRAPSNKMTWAKLIDLIKEGRGQGHLAAYDPWLKVTGKVSSPVSNIGRFPGTDLGRQHHYLAVAERNTILLLKWIGAFDVREQFPIWPWEHHHPLEGLSNEAVLEKLPGLVSIAKECGIPHGVFWGTSIPYVATIDVLSTWLQPDGTFKLLATECKPADLLDGDKKSKRIQERLSLSGNYCKLADIPRKVFHAEQLPLEFRVNLDALFPRMSRAAVDKARQTDNFKWMVDAMRRHGYNRRPHEIAHALTKKIGATFDEVKKMFHLALWTQDIDHDISAHLELYRPLIPGGRDLHARWSAEMWRGTV